MKRAGEEGTVFWDRLWRHRKWQALWAGGVLGYGVLLVRGPSFFSPALFVLLLTLAALLSAGPLMRLIGNKGEAVITRLLGVLLAALAAQFVIDGLKASFPSLA